MSSGREVTSVNEYPTADGNVGAAAARDVLYAQVCPLDLPYRAARLFDYKVPTELRGVLRRGDFVTVPFGQGNRPCTALVMSVSDVPSPREGGGMPRYKELCDPAGYGAHSAGGSSRAGALHAGASFLLDRRGGVCDNTGIYARSCGQRIYSDRARQGAHLR